MKNIFSFVIFLLAFIASINAQSSKDFDAKYLAAKQLLNKSQYLQAMELFKPLLVAHKNNKHQAEAKYFFANAAIKVKDYNAVFAISTTFFAEHSTWYGIDDFRYLYEIALFAKSNFTGALLQDAALKDESLKKQSNILQSQYLNSSLTIDTLLALNQKFADNTFIKNLLENEQKRAKKAAKVGKFKVAILLPFDINNLKTSAVNKRENQYALDFYLGFKEGFQNLTTNNIEYFAYDCGKDSIQLKNLLKLPELKSMDLLVGPVFGSLTGIASNFAKENKILFVNPLSDNLKTVQNKPNSFLYRASIQTIAEQTALYAYNKFDLKKGILFYSKATSDTAFANSFARKYFALGGSFEYKQRTDSYNSLQFPKLLGKDTLANAGFVMVCSGEQMVATNLITALAMRNTGTPVLASSDWLAYNSLDFEQFEKYNFYFYYPEFVDFSNENVKKFKATYLKNHNILPSNFAFIGYDLIQYYSTLLDKYGRELPNNISEIPTTNGTLLEQHFYGKNKDNQIFPILKFENSKLVQVN